MTKPLIIVLDEAKSKLFSAFNQIQQETALPAYLLEGSVLELLAEIRARKNIEFIAAMEETALSQNDTADEK